jgi:hypothetical protein
VLDRVVDLCLKDPEEAFLAHMVASFGSPNDCTGFLTELACPRRHSVLATARPRMKVSDLNEVKEGLCPVDMCTFLTQRSRRGTVGRE